MGPGFSRILRWFHHTQMGLPCSRTKLAKRPKCYVFYFAGPREPEVLRKVNTWTVLLQAGQQQFLPPVARAARIQGRGCAVCCRDLGQSTYSRGPGFWDTLPVREASGVVSHGKVIISGPGSTNAPEFFHHEEHPAVETSGWVSGGKTKEKRQRE